jgi:type 1 glutamine amidotransferase
VRPRVSSTPLAAFSCAAALLVGMGAAAEQAAQAPQRQGGPSQAGGGRGGVASSLFTATDANKDGAVTREELKATFDRWFTEWDSAKGGSLTREQLLTGLSAAMPQPPAPAGGGGRGAAQNQTPDPAHVQATIAALPEKAPAAPKQARKVLVIGRAAGFVHSSIPIAARTIDELGKKTGAWSTTITYDAGDVNEQNLKQYDAIVLVSTTGHFLDDPDDRATTAARRKAFLDFVRGGKGLVGIHAATDAYHESASAAAGRTGRSAAPAAPGRRGGGGRGGPAGTLATRMLAQGDTDKDQKLTRVEMGTLADVWFDTIDPSKTGRVSRQDFPQRFAAVQPAPAQPALGPTGFPVQPRATQLGPDDQVGTWPEFNTMIGGMFKFHWNDGQEITLKIDEPDHPLNAMFKGRPQFKIVDETYTFGRNVYSRENLRVLKSVDYGRMSAEDKAKEQLPRTDGDYALSWVRREGKGRVFYEAHGHNEKVYAIGPFLEHLLAGIQYALGDLRAEDGPSRKPGAK